MRPVESAGSVLRPSILLLPQVACRDIVGKRVNSHAGHAFRIVSGILAACFTGLKPRQEVIHHPRSSETGWDELGMLVDIFQLQGMAPHPYPKK